MRVIFFEVTVLCSQLISIAEDSIGRPHNLNLARGDAKREVDDAPFAKAVLTRWYADFICGVVCTGPGGCATHGTDNCVRRRNEVLPS